MTMKSRPIKIQCQNCPARNRWVKLYDFRKQGTLVARVMLCEKCAAVAQRLVAEDAKVPCTLTT